MSNLSIIATVTALLGALVYALAAARLIFSLRSEISVTPSPLLLGVIGALLHLATIVFDAIQYNGLSSSFFDALSITALIIVAMTLVAQMTHHVTTLLIPVYVIATICLTQAVFFAHHTPIAAQSPGILAHILSSIIAYSLLSLATVQAIVLQLQERGLKRHEVSPWLRRLPPLQTMEVLLFQIITIGWLALTVAILSGGIYVDDLFAQHLVHKTVFSLLSWLLFGLLLLGRKRYGWRGATAVKWTLAAFVALALGYFGSKFVLEVILHRA